MTIGNKIAHYRKAMNITQDALAQQLDVSNQAVSKWESDQCCPDIQLLPRLADIFGITIDELFDRPAPTVSPGLPWTDDNTLHAVLYRGHELLLDAPEAREITIKMECDALNVESAFSVSCGDVAGNVHAGGNVTCDDVGGDIQASGSVNCDTVDGDVEAGGNIACDDIGGNAQAGGNITCDEICGSAQAGCGIDCDEMGTDHEKNDSDHGWEFHFRF
ncbi:MAG: helix-turn-helix domain-containing protein [Faecousia sp.]